MTLDIFLSIIIVLLYWITHHNLVCKIEQLRKEMRKNQRDIMERLQSLDNTQTLSNLYMIRQTIDKNDKVTQSKFDNLLKKYYPEK